MFLLGFSLRETQDALCSTDKNWRSQRKSENSTVPTIDTRLSTVLIKTKLAVSREEGMFSYDYDVRARKYMDEGKYSDAIADWFTMLEWTMGYADFQIGVCYHNLADYSNALKYYNYALERDPTDAYALGNRSVIKYYVLDDVSGACADARAAVKHGAEDFRDEISEFCYKKT